jgi:hypothetical protein
MRLHAAGVISTPELRRMIGYNELTDEEQRKLAPPRYVVARVVYGSMWRMAPRRRRQPRLRRSQARLLTRTDISRAFT